MTKSAWVFAFLLCCIVGSCIIFHYLIITNVNAKWYLILADQLLHGQRYYQDAFEMDPPLIILYSMPFVMIAHLFSLNSYLVLSIGVYVLMLWLLYINYKLLTFIFRNDKRAVFCFLIFIAIAEFTFSYLAFLEREQLAVVLFLPYLLLLIIFCEKRAEVSVHFRSGIAILAALGLALKPYFVLPLVFLEVYRAIKVRKWISFFRLETYLILVCFVLYLVIVLLFFREYYTKIFPLGAALYVPFCNTIPVKDLLFSASSWMGFAALPIAVLYILLNKKSTWIAVFSLAALGFLLAALYARQETYYHFYPAIAMNIMLFLMMAYFSFKMLCLSFDKSILWVLKESFFLLASVLGFLLGLQIMFCLSFSLVYTDHFTLQEKMYLKALSICSDENKVPTLFIVSNLMLPTVLGEERQMKMTSRFVNALLFQGITALQLLGEMQKSKNYQQQFFGIINEDLQRRPPTCIIIDRSGYWLQLGPNYIQKDFLSFLMLDPPFKWLFSSFKCHLNIQSLDVYTRC